jgi:hypothetical protein
MVAGLVGTGCRRTGVGSSGLVAQGAGEVEFDPDFLFDVDHEGAGISEAPLDVGHWEGTDGVDLVAADLHLHGNVDLVRRAEEGEEAVNLEGGVAGGVEGSGEAGWGEGDGFVVGGFELLFGHAVVADGVAAFAAEGVHDDGAVGVAGGGIEGYVSLLDVEGSANGVEGVDQGEMNFAAGGIEGELVLSFVLAVQDCGGGSGGDQQEGVAKEVSRRGEAGRGVGGTMEAVEHGAEETPFGVDAV